MAFEPRAIGRYVIHRELASGGMASVCLGKLRSGLGFSRVVAIKRLFPQYARDPEVVRMFMDEARVAGRVKHPNVVGTLDVVSDQDELFLVMEYIEGASLARLLASARDRGEPIEPAIASAIVIDLLEGLHAAHIATDPSGTKLDIVHRDVSPQNVLVGADGVSRVVDFGVAKAIGRSQSTDEGQVKGKLLYMAPEQMKGSVDARADLWAAGVVLWEILTGRRMFADVPDAMKFHTENTALSPPAIAAGRETMLDAIAMRALSRDPAERFQDAREMIVAIEKAVPRAPARRVAQWILRLAGDELERNRALVAEVEAYEVSTALDASASIKPPKIAPEPPRRSKAPFAIAIAIAGVLAFVVMGGIGLRALTHRSAPTAVPAAAANTSAPAAASAPPAPPTPVETSVTTAVTSASSAPIAAHAPTTKPNVRRPPASKPTKTAEPGSGGDPLELDRRK